MSNHRHFSSMTMVALCGFPIMCTITQQERSRAASLDDRNCDFREKCILSEATIKALSKSLAIANAETEIFKHRYDDLNERIEALGIPPIGKENEIISNRLFAAVRDLRILKNDDDSARSCLTTLREAVIRFLENKGKIDVQSRLKIEQELRRSNSFLYKSRTTSSDLSLTRGAIIDYKHDLSLIVANLGSRHGVKLGMPFQVWRGDQKIALVTVVDVRDDISGAIIQSTMKPNLTIQEGDTLLIDTIN